MVQDITELDYSSHTATEGLGPIGDHRGRGLLVHNTLAIEPSSRQVIGLAYQQVWYAMSKPTKVKKRAWHVNNDRNGNRAALSKPYKPSAHRRRPYALCMWQTERAIFSRSSSRCKRMREIFVCVSSRIVVWPNGARKRR